MAMTDDKVMAWLKDKETHIKNKTENRKYTFGVTLNSGDLPYIHRLQHILCARKGLMAEQSPFEGVMQGHYFCPRCSIAFHKNEKPNYCSNCGQKLDWKDYEE